jgi:hypothetical protein
MAGLWLGSGHRRGLIPIPREFWWSPNALETFETGDWTRRRRRTSGAWSMKGPSNPYETFPVVVADAALAMPPDISPAPSPPEVPTLEQPQSPSIAEREPVPQSEDPIWSQIVEPHFDAEVRRNGPFPSLGKAREAVKSLLQDREKAAPHDRTIERRLNAYRSGWFRKGQRGA